MNIQNQGEVAQKEVKKAKKTPLRERASRSIQRIALLYLFVTVLLAVLIALYNHYNIGRFFESRTIIINNVHANKDESQVIEEPKVVDPAEIDKDKKNSEKKCTEYIKKYAKQYQVSEDLLSKMANCESGHKPTSDNNTSTASGCFQFIDGTWEAYGKKLWGSEYYEKNVYDPNDNVELAAWTISKYGTGDWNASKHCWGK